MVFHAVCTLGCHAMLKAFEQICGPAGTHRLKAPGLLLSPTAPRLLSPSHCTAHVLGHGLWLRKDDTFYAQQIHHCKRLDTLMGASFRVDTCHESTLINISRTRCGQAGKMATALSISVSINWLKFAVRMD